MATHGPCETEGPGPRYAGVRTCGPGIKDITAGVQAGQRHFLTSGDRTTTSWRCHYRPGDTGLPGPGK